MDKINIVSSQAVLEMYSFSMHTRSMSSSPLVNSLVRNRLLRPQQTLMIHNFISSTLWICLREWVCSFLTAHTMDLSAVDTMVHDSSDLVIHRTENWAVWRSQREAWTQESLAFLDAAVQLLHVRGAVCQCTVLLEQSRYQTLCVLLAAVWRHYNAAKQRRISQIYH